MKTEKQIKDEIQRIIESHRNWPIEKAKNKELLFLKNCLFYLETNPNEDFIKKQIEKSSQEITKIESRPYYNNSDTKEFKYEQSARKNEVSIKRQQIELLEYILN